MYSHTQKGPWGAVMFFVAAAFFAAGWFMAVPGVRMILLATGVFMLLLGASLGHLTVEDEGSQLAIRFGPFPLFRKRIWYEDILDAEKQRTTLFDGWGIHLSLRGGWVWNIWGYDCVLVRLNRGKIWIGTDDPDGLLQFLKNRISLTT